MCVLAVVVIPHYVNCSCSGIEKVKFHTCKRYNVCSVDVPAAVSSEEPKPAANEDQFNEVSCCLSIDVPA